MNPTLPTLLLSTALYAQAQANYQAPRRIEFANVTVQLDESARKLVQADINALLSNRNSLNNRLERAVLYFPIVEEVFDREKIPDDFKFLVLQESGLVPDAVSTSNAVGFWQFKRETAGDFKMRVDDEVDERKNIHAATWAAAQYLKRSNGILDNWVSSLFSYYLGLGAVRLLLPPDWVGARDVQATDKTDRYILRCLAHKIVFEPELQSFKSATRQRFYEYTGCAGKTFRQIAEELQVDEVELRRHNRWVGTSKVPDDKEYVMLVPVTVDQYAAVRSRAKASLVRPREEVAQATTSTALPTNPSRTGSGTRPAAPARPTASRTVASKKMGRNEPGYPKLKRVTPALRNENNVPIYYEINGKRGILAQKGDTYETIAKRGNIKPKKFLTFNDLDESDVIVPGQVYYLKKKWKTAEVPQHILESNQSLWQVAHMYGVRLDKLSNFNRLDKGESVAAGRVLWLQQTRPANRPVETRTLAETPATPPTDVARTEPQPESPRTQPDPRREVGTKPPVSTPAKPEAESDVRIVDSAPMKTAGSSRVTMVPESGARTSPANTPEPPRSAPANTPVESKPTVTNRASTPEPVRTVETPAERRPSAAATSSHTVVAGETFYAIARKYGITPQDLRDLNGFTDFPSVQVGQVLKVTGSGASVPTTSKPVAEKSNVPASHTVVAGETFYAIARKYGMTPQDLRDLNGFTEFPTVKIGQKLKVR